MNNEFLPVSRQDLGKRGWSELDIVLISGDAYVDHPSYGVALIGRLLESHGFKVGIISQPDWRTTDDFTRLGKPRLFFGITSGNTDSLIANYTANKRLRKSDEYSPGNQTGLRPDRAVIVYANMVRKAYKNVPIVLGGIEASLRRLAHYDYWDNSVRRSILIDSKADILVYGMAEQAVIQIAEELSQGKTINQLKPIRGTVIVRSDLNFLKDYLTIPSFEEVKSDTEKFTQAFLAAYKQMNPFSAKTLVQPHDKRFVIQFAPAMPLTSQELDALYELPYKYAWHPMYDKRAGVKSLETVKFSLTSHRGCCGQCSFCALYFHQGCIVQSRSIASLLREAERMAKRSDFKGTITDVGGPTANFYAAQCALWEKSGFCADKQCLIPSQCKNLKLAYEKYLELLGRLRKIPGVKHVFIGSGLRYDTMVSKDTETFLQELCQHHISGLLKVAPEHCSNTVLSLMNKPEFSVYETFVSKFKHTAHALKKNIFVVNYFLSAHPGATLNDALKLALYLAKRGVCPEQIQDFIPTPMTVSTCMYYTGKNPFTGKKVYVARTFRERKMQRALIQYNKPSNRPLIVQALKELNAMHVLRKLLTASKRKSGKIVDSPRI